LPQTIHAHPVVITEDIRRFVLTSIPSIPYLEAALLFHGSPEVERTCAEVARALYLPEAKVRELLEALCHAGVLALVPGDAPRYRYAPCDATLADSLQKLAKAYAADMIGVTHLIHDTTGKNAHRFADAFRLRKDR
jgi:hypothetical protein